MLNESRRELIEMKSPSGLRKIYLAETRRFVKLLIAQLEWYGVPYEFKRLPSTICPICHHELTQLQGRIMVCENCGFKAPRDKVPMHWALKAMPKAKVSPLDESPMPLGPTATHEPTPITHVGEVEAPRRNT